MFLSIFCGVGVFRTPQCPPPIVQLNQTALWKGRVTISIFANNINGNLYIALKENILAAA